MKKLLQLSKLHITNKNIYWTNKPILKKIIQILNKDKLLIISWLKNIWKLNLINELINTTKINNNFYYFNKDLDTKNKIKTNKDLENNLNVYINLYKKPKIIILENFWKILWIKDFIPKIFEQNYRIILIWNNIKIQSVKEIEILQLSNANISKNLNSKDNLQNNKTIVNQKNIKPELDKNTIINTKILYWNFYEINNLNSTNTKQVFLNKIKNDIYINEIIQNFWVKNIYLYNFIITFIANINSFTSIRELQREINIYEKISLKTLMDYIDFGIKSKILKRIYKFDIKKDKIISSKSKYYFTDTGLRNAYNFFDMDFDILYENYIFLELLNKDYKIYSWINGKFDFDFIATKNEEKIYVHISKSKEKEKIKKQIKKLNKIGDNFIKFLVIENIEKFKFRKFEYGNVRLDGSKIYHLI